MLTIGIISATVDRDGLLEQDTSNCLMENEHKIDDKNLDEYLAPVVCLLAAIHLAE